MIKPMAAGKLKIKAVFNDLDKVFYSQLYFLMYISEIKQVISLWQLQYQRHPKGIQLIYLGGITN